MHSRSKYALAVVDIILECLDDDVGLGYDIGCHFKTTLANSKLGPLAFAKRLRCLLLYLATYIKGLGREDLETLERFFSRSNAPARSCRNASRFHRQQEITTYLKYTDVFETYPNLSQVISTRYKSALKLLADEPAVQQLMQDEGIVAQDFDDALREEREHLLALKASSTKPVETLEISYVKSLQKLQASRAAFSGTPGRGAMTLLLSLAAPKPRLTYGMPRSGLTGTQKVVESLEVSLDIVNRWQTNWPQYKKAEHDALLLRYQQSLDRLELLLVQRFLEFTRMNQSGTGYQLRQHLGKAMQVRSKTIRAALAVYNELAVLLDRPPLEWDEIVNITFLSDFDLLRDSTSNIHNRRWARPAFRDLMHRYFRIVRAREEIVRLNVEIPRVLTWMRDDSDFLRQMEQSLRRVEGKSPAQIEGDLLLAVQLQDYAQQKHRFDDVHRRRFHDLSKLPGFTGSLELGVALPAKWNPLLQQPEDYEAPPENAEEEGQGAPFDRRVTAKGTLVDMFRIFADDEPASEAPEMHLNPTPAAPMNMIILGRAHRQNSDDAQAAVAIMRTDTEAILPIRLPSEFEPSAHAAELLGILRAACEAPEDAELEITTSPATARSLLGKAEGWED
ncbi:hypothetical protein MKEN_00443000 [Mycena kentingensis (nom. inval.)]|nr:hypothetical protein MKEN_00443000 [Mycena kentingensis (nom. inval.)]